MFLDEKPTIPIILDCEQSLRMVTRAKKSSEASESKNKKPRGIISISFKCECHIMMQIQYTKSLNPGRFELGTTLS